MRAMPADLPPPEPWPELLMIPESARICRMSVKWIEKQIRLGRLAKIKMGNRSRIERAELQRFIQANKVQIQPAAAPSASDLQGDLFKSDVTETVTTPSSSEG